MSSTQDAVRARREAKKAAKVKRAAEEAARLAAEKLAATKEATRVLEHHRRARTLLGLEVR